MGTHNAIPQFMKGRWWKMKKVISRNASLARAHTLKRQTSVDTRGFRMPHVILCHFSHTKQSVWTNLYIFPRSLNQVASQDITAFLFPRQDPINAWRLFTICCWNVNSLWLIWRKSHRIHNLKLPFFTWKILAHSLVSPTTWYRRHNITNKPNPSA